MSFPGTSFTGPVISGDIPNTFDVLGNGTTVTYHENTGVSVLTQNVTIQATATANAATAYVPQNSQLIDFKVDTLTAWGNNSAALTIGTPSNASAYVPTVNIGTTATRVALPTLNGTGLTNMFNVGTTQAVVFNILQSSVNTTGETLITMLYAQTTR